MIMHRRYKQRMIKKSITYTLSNICQPTDCTFQSDTLLIISLSTAIQISLFSHVRQWLTCSVLQSLNFRQSLQPQPKSSVISPTITSRIPNDNRYSCRYACKDLVLLLNKIQMYKCMVCSKKRVNFSLRNFQDSYFFYSFAYQDL